MAISRQNILAEGQQFNPGNFLEEQQKREPHHVISLILSINWKSCNFKKLSQYVFPQCAIVTITNIEYATKNTRKSMDLNAKESEIMLDYKTAFDQVDEIVKPLENTGMFHLTSLRGASKTVAQMIESCLLPEAEYESILINDEEVIRLAGDFQGFSYPALKVFLTEQAPKNIFANIDNDKIAQMAENTRKELLQCIQKASSFARKHVGDTDKEINNARIGKGGKSSYDPFFDEAMMRFLAIDAKFEVSPESGLRMQPKADVIVQQSGNDGSGQVNSSEIALLKDELRLLREQVAKPVVATPSRPTKRCYQCASDIFLEARKCHICGGDPQDPDKLKDKDVKETKDNAKKGS